jgi:transposase
MTEQRYRAVLEVQAGVPVTEVAERFGISRQAVHRWRRWYENEGLDGLADRSHRPHAHPAQTSPKVEAAICELRRAHPRWGQRRIEFELGRNGCPGPVPSLSTIYRVLVRHGLVDAIPRRRRRQDYKRWQRERPMELWPDPMGSSRTRGTPGQRASRWRGRWPVGGRRRCNAAAAARTAALRWCPGVGRPHRGGGSCRGLWPGRRTRRPGGR